MPTIKLYDFLISGNCYKVRLLLSMLALEYERVPVDLAGGESQTDEFKKLNPRGQVPVLVDGDTTIWDSMAILSYLARKYGGTGDDNGSWLPNGVIGLTHVMQWLAVSENELLYGLARARATLIFNRPFDLEQCQAEGRIGLVAMEQQLAKQKWLASDTPTIADIACYPYVSLASDGEVSLDEYFHVQRWMKDFEGLPGWQPIQ